MQTFLRLCALGFVLVVIVSCQPKLASIQSKVKPEMLPLSVLFSQLERRHSGIRDVKAFIRTKISGDHLNQTFRQALLIRKNEAIRIETFNLFRQVMSVLIHNDGRTLMYIPSENQIVQGDEVTDIMRQFTGYNLDLGIYIDIFSGKIPRFSHLLASFAAWKADQTNYYVEAFDQETDEKVIIEIDGYTQLPKSATLIQDERTIYRVYWSDYRKVNQWDFAHNIVIEFNAKNEVVAVKYSDISINQEFAANAFQFDSALVNQ